MIVCDTNLLVYLLLPGEHTEAAERVLDLDPEWSAPVLWRSEFRNVLAVYLRKKLLAREDALEAYDQAQQVVRGREHEVETEGVLDLVLRSACSAYDGEFVWLARQLDVPLVTSDARVLGAFPTIAVAPEQFAAEPPA